MDEEQKFNIGDKVKKVNGNPFSATGIIKCVFPFTGPAVLQVNLNGAGNTKQIIIYDVEQEDGRHFTAMENELALVKKAEI